MSQEALSIAILAALTLAAAVLAALAVRLPGRLEGRAAQILQLACRFALAAVFLAAAYGKLRDPYAFAVSIHAYRLTPASWAAIGAVAMPAIEVAAALAVASGLCWRGGAVVLIGLLLVFIVGLGQAIMRGIDIECGCFGEGSSPVSYWLIARNYLLIIAALVPLAYARRRDQGGLAA